jgi:FtsZ-binding cell division protein ZapB
MAEFFIQLGDWFVEQKDIILTTLGVGGGTATVVAAATAFIKNSVGNLITKSTDEVSLLKEEIDELKETNILMAEYIKLSSDVKAQSTVVSDELKTKFNNLSTLVDEKKTALVETLKDKITDTINKF